MYEQFFRLSHTPFDISPDPAFLFATPEHSEALAAITYGIEKRKGLIVLTGEVGLGKTTLLRTYLNRVDRSDLDIAYVLHPAMDFLDLLGVIGEAIGLEAGQDLPLFQLVSAIQQRLIDRYRSGHNMAVIIDEAQRLPDVTLENLRLLSNLETESEKLIQIVLVGQPELDSHLQRNEMRQIAQRIALRAHLHPLNTDAAIAYLRHRLRLAGAQDPETVMTAAAMRRLAVASGGVPRVMNILADNTLIHAFAEQRAPVPAAIVDQVVKEYFERPPLEDAAQATFAPSTRRSSLVLAGVAFAVGVAAMAVLNTRAPGRESAGETALALIGSEDLSRSKPDPVVLTGQNENSAIPPVAVEQDVPLPVPADAAMPQPGADVAASIQPGGATATPGGDGSQAPAVEVAAVSPAPAPEPALAQPPSLQINLPTVDLMSTQAALPPPDVLPSSTQPAPVSGEISHVVQVGDTLFRLVVQYYGVWTEQTRDLVLRRNPVITNSNLIWIGQPLAFPPAPSDLPSQASTAGSQQARSQTLSTLESHSP